MAMVNTAASQGTIKLSLENEQRDVKVLWNNAVKSYQAKCGKDKSGMDLTSFKDLNAVQRYGELQASKFDSYRHSKSRGDKIRRRLMESMGYIKAGCQKIAEVASTAFPAAGTISAALIFILSGCEGVTADYDVIDAFFDDLNNFLQRVSIIETMLPPYRAYQACLMDVFTSFLTMCAFARSYIEKGRFEKWVTNAFKGQDADLAGARMDMDKTLARLQSATEFAILANTEDLKSSQHQMEKMQKELQANQIQQYELSKSQSEALEAIQRSNESVRDGIHDVQADIKAMLALVMAQERKETAIIKNNASNEATSNKARSVVAENFPNISRMRRLREIRVAGTGEWLFQSSSWKAWSNSKNFDLLVLGGSPGVGKSCLASIIYDRLVQTARQDPGAFSIVTYFFCDDRTDSLKSLQFMVNALVLQISQKNTSLSDHFSRQLSTDKTSMKDSDYLEKLIFPCFEHDSKYDLTIVVDGYDELEQGSDHMSFTGMVEMIRELGLRIKILATARADHPLSITDRSQAGFETLMKYHYITKDDILSDAELMINDRFQSNDSVYACFRSLRDSSRISIRIRLKEQASTLLYVDLALKYISGIGREGAILRMLNEDLPKDLDSVLTRMIKSCQRRLLPDLRSAVQSLIIWLSYGLETLDLDQANHVVRMVGSGEQIRVEEEIGELFARFLQIGPVSVTSEKTLDPSSQGQLLSGENDQDIAYDDGSLPISFRDRSIRDLFSVLDIEAWTQGNTSISSPSMHRESSRNFSNGHRYMFLQCCKIFKHPDLTSDQDQRTIGARKLERYAIKYCLRHWQYINQDEHSVLENTEVCDAFYELISDRHGFPSILEKNSTALAIDKLVLTDSLKSYEQNYKDFFHSWNRWAVYMRDTRSNTGDTAGANGLVHQDYWNGDEKSALLPLVRAHLENWLDPPDYYPALQAYASLRRVLKHTALSRILFMTLPDDYESWLIKDDSYTYWDGTVDCNDEITESAQILAAFDVPITDNASFGIAALLFRLRGMDEALERITHAIETCDSSAGVSRQLRNRVLLGEIQAYHSYGMGPKYVQDEYINESIHNLDTAIALIATGRSRLVACALQRKAWFYWFHQEDHRKAAKVLQEMQNRSPDHYINQRNIFTEEFTTLTRKDHLQEAMDCFVRLEPVQRLSMMIDLLQINRNPIAEKRSLWQPSIPEPDYGSGVVLITADRTNRLGDLRVPYISIVEALNAGNRDLLWRYHLANYYYRASGENGLALDTIRRAFQHTISEPDIRFGSVVKPTSTVVTEYVELASDILYKAFKTAKKPGQKFAILEEVEGMIQTPLSLSILIPNTQTVPYLTIAATMAKKAGAFQKYQDLLQQAFDICWTNLHDDFVENDSVSMRHLAKVLAVGPSNMREEAGVVGSAQVYWIGKLSTLKEREIDKTWTKEDAEGARIDRLDNAKENFSIYIDLMRDRSLDLPLPGYARCARFDRCGTTFSDWEMHNYYGNPMYTCLQCVSTYLCRECYEERTKRNNGEEGDGRLDFCCTSNDYLKVPCEDWEGITDGFVCIGEDFYKKKPLPLQRFLNETREKWIQAWDEFWTG